MGLTKVELKGLDDGTDGQIITYDASGNPVAVGPGTDGQVLTSTGAGSPPAFEAIPAAAVTAINNATQNELVTVGSTTTELDAEANLQFDGTAFRIGPSTKSSHTTVNDIFLGGAAHMYAETTAGAGNSFSVSQNAHVASDGGWKYVVTDEASNIYQYAGRIGFRTAVSGSADSAISWTEPATVWPHGITFNGDTAAANALDDYEEGLYQPTVTASGSGSWSTNSYTYLAYTKIGRLVHVSGYININADNSANGDVRISLPFTAGNFTENADSGSLTVSLRGHNASADLYNVSGVVLAGVANFEIVSVRANGTHVWVGQEHCDASWNVRVGGAYYTA